MEIFLNCYGHNIHANQKTKCLSINKDNQMTKHGARIEQIWDEHLKKEIK
jgi:hypothetical protein